jgi:hypothetical protein
MPETKTPTAPIFRLGRPPVPWEPPDWSRAHSDGTFGNRFDDPTGYYRVLYESSQRLSCFIETLARFRPGLNLLAELDGIAGEGCSKGSHGFLRALKMSSVAPCFC